MAAPLTWHDLLGPIKEEPFFKNALAFYDAEVAAGTVLLDITGVDGDDDLDVVGEALQHAELAVGLEAGKHAARMVVVEQLAAELEVELAAELGDALLDVLGLQADVLIVIESLAHGAKLLPYGTRPQIAYRPDKYSRAPRQRQDEADGAHRFSGISAEGGAGRRAGALLTPWGMGRAAEHARSP